MWEQLDYRDNIIETMRQHGQDESSVAPMLLSQS